MMHTDRLDGPGWAARSGRIATSILLFALALGRATASAADLQPTTAPERDAAVVSLAKQLSATYIKPEMARWMAALLLKNRKNGRYEALSDGQAFADQLTADLRKLGNDKHLWVGFRPDGAQDEPVDGPTTEQLDQWRDGIARDNFAFDRVERLPGNIGYVKFRIFAYPYIASDTAAAAMSFVAHTDALIIDLRDNMGGDPEMVAFLASYLFDVPTRLNDLRSRDGQVRQYWTLPKVPGTRFGGKKPIYVLTSTSTFSAAEDFAYALQTRGRAVIVGEPTGGGAQPSREIRIGERFTAAIPYAESISPVTGKNWEGTGVVPNALVPAADALEAARRFALNKLIEEAGGDGRAQEWKDLIK
jgi:hypothetical protein